MATLGLIVNPVAGVGGRLALHGSDDADAVARALRDGARLTSSVRAQRALAVLCRAVPNVEVLATPGSMGAEATANASCVMTALDLRLHAPTVAADTRAAAAELLRCDPDLLLFAGGDGTA